MDIFELISQRASVRSYRPDPVSRENLETIVRAGCMAPTACNLQPFHIVVLPDNTDVLRCADAYNRDWFLAAPAALIVCVDEQKGWVRRDNASYARVDAAIVMVNAHTGKLVARYSIPQSCTGFHLAGPIGLVSSNNGVLVAISPGELTVLNTTASPESPHPDMPAFPAKALAPFMTFLPHSLHISSVLS